MFEILSEILKARSSIISEAEFSYSRLMCEKYLNVHKNFDVNSLIGNSFHTLAAYIVKKFGNTQYISNCNENVIQWNWSSSWRRSWNMEGLLCLLAGILEEISCNHFLYWTLGLVVLRLKSNLCRTTTLTFRSAISNVFHGIKSLKR